MHTNINMNYRDAGFEERPSNAIDEGFKERPSSAVPFPSSSAHSSIDNLIGMSDLKQLWDSMKGKNIFGQEVSPVTKEDMLDIAMSVSPIGASIRGGKVAKPILDQLLGLSKKLGIKQGVSNLGKHLPKKVQDYLFQNKLNAARLQKQKVLDKLDMEDPDKIFRGFSEN